MKPEDSNSTNTQALSTDGAASHVILLFAGVVLLVVVDVSWMDYLNCR